MTADDRTPPPSVSVVIPTYNRAATVRSSIESVLAQTYDGFELIVVDDGSVDETVAVVAGIDDPRLRLIENASNLGPAGARNAGVAEARGTWIAFHDSDDEWLPWKLERQMARLQAEGEPYLAAYCGLLILGGLDHDDADRMRVSYVPDPSVEAVEGDIVKTLLTTNVISTQTLVVRRDAILAVGGFDPAAAGIEDWDCAISLAGAGKIAFIDEPLVFQRFSPNSITRNQQQRVESTVHVVEKHLAEFATFPGLLARQYFIIAGGYRQMGDLGAARRYLREARRLQPRRLRLVAMSVVVAAQQLVAGRKGVE